MTARNYVKKHMNTFNKPSIIHSARDKKLGTTLAKEMGEEALQILTDTSRDVLELKSEEIADGQSGLD